MVGWHHRLSEHEFEQTPGDSEGQGSLACCGSWGRKESDMTYWLNKTLKKRLCAWCHVSVTLNTSLLYCLGIVLPEVMLERTYALESTVSNSAFELRDPGWIAEPLWSSLLSVLSLQSSSLLCRGLMGRKYLVCFRHIIEFWVSTSYFVFLQTFIQKLNLSTETWKCKLRKPAEPREALLSLEF